MNAELLAKELETLKEANKGLIIANNGYAKQIESIRETNVGLVQTTNAYKAQTKAHREELEGKDKEIKDLKEQLATSQMNWRHCDKQGSDFYEQLEEELEKNETKDKEIKDLKEQLATSQMNWRHCDRQGSDFHEQLEEELEKNETLQVELKTVKEMCEKFSNLAGERLAEVEKHKQINLAMAKEDMEEEQRLKGELKRKEKELEVLVKSSAMQCEALKVANGGVVVINEGLKEQIKELKTDNNNLIEECRLSNEKLFALQRTHKDLQTAYESQTGLIGSLRDIGQRKEKACDILEEELDGWRTSYAEDMGEVERERNSWKTKFDELLTECNQVREAKNMAQKCNIEASSMIQTIQADSEHLIKDLRDQVGGLEKELESKESFINALVKESIDTKKCIKELEKQIAFQENNVRIEHNELVRCQKELKEVRETIGTYRERQNDYIKELQRLGYEEQNPKSGRPYRALCSDLSMVNKELKKRFDEAEAKLLVSEKELKNANESSVIWMNAYNRLSDDHSTLENKKKRCIEKIGEAQDILT